MKKYLAITDRFAKKDRFIVQSIKGKNAQEVLNGCDNKYGNSTNTTVMTLKTAKELALQIAIMTEVVI
jgi:FAD synthase